jgi:cytosine/adenosine deaminase-related metal-dependent hydrolase
MLADVLSRPASRIAASGIRTGRRKLTKHRESVMSELGLSRRGFMGSVGAGGLALGAGLTTSAAAAATARKIGVVTTPVANVEKLPSAYYLTNVRLETGFEQESFPWLEGPVIVATKTELKTLRIADGKIAEILPDKAKIPAGAAAYDAQGQIMLPTMRDMHIHLDKTYYGGPWKATLPRQHGRSDVIAQEKTLLPQLVPLTQERTAAIVRLMHAKGTTVCRNHCNVDPVQGLKNLENLSKALETFKDTLDYETIAFPQHGLIASDSVGLMRDALKTGLVQWVGGVDPTSFDNALEKSVDTTLQLAIDFNAGIDIHIHEASATAIPAVNRMMDAMEKNKQLQGKVTISHFFGLAELSPAELKDYLARMAALGVSIASSVPMGKGVMPLRQAHEAGVKVMFGTDSVLDWWNIWGSGDMLEKSNQLAQLNYSGIEYHLNRAFGYATGFVTPLNDKGEQVWPKAGDEASFNLLPASCSAEAVARLPERTAVFHKGRLAAGGLDKVA